MQAGVLGWVAWSRASSGNAGAELTLVVALLPLAATGLLFLRATGMMVELGAALAVVAAVLGALVGLGISICSCSPQTFDADAIALFVLAVVILPLAVAGLAGPKRPQ